MPTPDFIIKLRKKIGHDLLWLPGVTGLVIDDTDRVLLVRRAGNRRWTLITGCLEPGEQSAAGIARVNDDHQSIDVGWFPMTELPGLPQRHKDCVKGHVGVVGTARFA